MTTAKIHADKTFSFKNQNIFVGLDVHKKSWKVTIRMGGRTLKTFFMNPDAAALLHHLNTHYPGANIYTVYEAGFCGFSIHRKLISLGVNNIIVNPADIPTTHKDKTKKSDTRDSRKLALELEKGGLEAIYVPQTEDEAFRALHRHREQLKKDRRRVMGRTQSLFHLHGIMLDENIWSKKQLAALKKKCRKNEGMFIIRSLVENYEYLQQKIDTVSKEIKRVRRERNLDGEIAILQTAPGIGELSAEVLRAELITPHRFSSDNAICSYVGLVPDTASTGDSEKTRGLTNRRQAYLRHVIIEAAWTASKKDPELALAFTRLCSRMKKSSAIVRIARKLLLRIKRIWLNMEPYQINKNISQTA